jgi:tetratricopeptide (TPR) repeat protein
VGLVFWCFVIMTPGWGVKGIQLTPEYMKCTQLLGEGNITGAVEALNPLLATEFEAQAKVEIGSILKRQAETLHSQAIAQFQEAATNLSEGILSGGLEGNEAAKALYELGLLYEQRLNNVDGAIRMYQNLLENHPGFLSADKVTFQLAACLEKTGKIEQAAGLYRDLVVKYPYSAFFATADQKMKSLSPGTKEAGAAIQVQEGVVEDAKSDEQAAKASQELAVMYEQSGDYRKAIEEYRKVAADSSSPEMARNAYQKLAGLLDEKERDYRGAAEVLEEMVNKFPNEPDSEQNLFKLGRIYEENLEDKKVRVRDNQVLYKVDDGNVRKAIEYYDRLTETAPDADISADAFLRKGELYETRLKEADLAREQYQNFLSRFPDHPKAEHVKEKLKNLE